MAAIKIKHIDDDGNETVYPSIKVAAEALGFSNSYISNRVADSEDSRFQRMPPEPRKPKPVKNPEDETSVVIRCTHGQKQAFLAACDMLQTNPEQFITSAMKTATLNAVHAMRENLIEVEGYDADDFEAGAMKSWRPKRGLDNIRLPVDILQ